MFMEIWLPVAIMLESFAAGAVYVWEGDYGRATYWLSAGTLNLAVIFLIR